ncbi:MAG TPA: phage holin family protein [Jiangellaceae bacterium]
MTIPESGARGYVDSDRAPYSERTTGGLPTTGEADERSIGDIVGEIASDLSNLVKQELDLAKTEAKKEAKKAARGAGMLGGAAVAAYLTLLFLSLCLMLLLDNWMHIAWAALIVAAVWGIAAAVLGLRGRKEFQEFNPSLETTQQTLKEDVQWAKEQKNS